MKKIPEPMKKKTFSILCMLLAAILLVSCGISEETKQKMREKSAKSSEINLSVVIEQAKKDLTTAVTDATEELKDTYEEYAPVVKEKGSEVIENAPDIVKSYVEHQADFYGDALSQLSGNDQEATLAFPEGREITGPYTVAWVSDGDTFAVYFPEEGTSIREDEQNFPKIRYVRLIGIDTPESVAGEQYLSRSDKQNSNEGKTASNLTKELLPKGSLVWLEKDVSDTDPYDRLLRYVYFVKDGETLMLNEYLLEQGMAKLMTIQPDSKYADTILLAAQQKAREGKKGFWADGFFTEE